VQKPHELHAAFWHCAQPHEKLKHLGVYPCGFRGYIGKSGGMRYIKPLAKCNLPHFDVITVSTCTEATGRPTVTPSKKFGNATSPDFAVTVENWATDSLVCTLMALISIQIQTLGLTRGALGPICGFLTPF
jgi:hypothetical protein